MTNGLAALVQQYLAKMPLERREYFYSLCPVLRGTEKTQSDTNISQKGEIALCCAAKTSTTLSVTSANNRS